MKWLRNFFGVGVFGLALTASLASPALARPMSGPVIRELNITDSEFMVLQNTGGQPLELKNYWLGYTSDDGATAGPSEQLPAVTLDQNEAIVLSQNPINTCGAAAAGDLPFSLSNSGGTLALWRFDSAATPASFSLIGSLSWDKGGTTSPDYLNLSDEDDADSDWYRPLPSASQPSPIWQVGDVSDCAFTPLIKAAPSQPTSINWPSNNDYPPFTMLPAKYVGASAGPSLPASDVGLKPPMINELLPNPAKPRTDDQDEFIELYNPNDTGFDLSGFKLVTGSTTSSRRHNYTFPAGTILKAKSFQAFKSSKTGLSLTNGGGQAWLFDPFGKTISQSGVYGEAKDGFAFALAGGKWYWTLLPTPSKANQVQQPGHKSGAAGEKTATIDGKPVTAIKGDKTSANNPAAGNSLAVNDQQPAPIHPTVLVLVAGLALAYGLYEYRHDLGNKLHQFRKYRAARRATRR